MRRLLQAMINSRNHKKVSIRYMMAQKDLEIESLRARVRDLCVDNSELGRENRKLRIRNGEVEVAYNSLKQILQNRGVETP